MATKINSLLQVLQSDGMMFSSWMKNNNLSHQEQTLYVKSGWIERISQGVYRRTGTTPTLFSALSAYNKQLNKQCVVGASTALDITGYSHFVPMGRPTAYLFTDKNERLPKWLLQYTWDMDIVYFTTKIFGTGMLGVETSNVEGCNLLVSSVERAFMECLYLSPEYYSIMDMYYVMEMMTAVRPQVIQKLLEQCSSVKVKRLFLYMAEKTKYQWVKTLDLSHVDLGVGKRSLCQRGVYDKKYLITIPQELVDYE